MAENDASADSGESAAREGRPNLIDVFVDYQVAADPNGTIQWEPTGGLLEAGARFLTDPIEITATEGKLLDSLDAVDLFHLRGIRDQAEAAADVRFPALEDRRGDFADDADFDFWAFTGGHNDAYRHTLANALMARDLGPEFAKQYGTAHEASAGNQAGMEAMDLYNNEVGRRIAAENPNASDAELADLVGAAVANGDVIVIDGKGDLAWSDEVLYGEHGFPDLVEVDGSIPNGTPALPADTSPILSEPAAQPEALPPTIGPEPQPAAAPVQQQEALPQAAPIPRPAEPAQSTPDGGSPTLGELTGTDGPPNGDDGIPIDEEDEPQFDDRSEDEIGAELEAVLRGEDDDSDAEDDDSDAHEDEEEPEAGGDGSERPNEVDDPSPGDGEITDLTDRNGDATNPRTDGSGAPTFDGDFSPIVDRHVFAINTGDGSFALEGVDGDIFDLLDRDAPAINTGSGDFDIIEVDGELSDLLDRNGPRQTFPLADLELASSTIADSLLSDSDFGSSFENLAGLEIA